MEGCYARKPSPLLAPSKAQPQILTFGRLGRFTSENPLFNSLVVYRCIKNRTNLISQVIFIFEVATSRILGHYLCLNVLKRRNSMTQTDRQQLIELGVLTPDCGPSDTYWKLSPELKREARQRMKEREEMTGGRLLMKILEHLRTAH